MPHDPMTRAFEHSAVDAKQRLQPPKLFSVSIHNDDYTPMDFVVHLLIKVFRKNYEEAAAIMMDVHLNGVRVVGVYSYDVAATKRAQGQQMAEQAGHPLKLTLEEVVS